MTWELEYGTVVLYIKDGFPRFGTILDKTSMARKYWIEPSLWTISETDFEVVHSKHIVRIYHT